MFTAPCETSGGCESCRRLKVFNSALYDVKDERELSLREAEAKIGELEDLLSLPETEAGDKLNQLVAEKLQILKIFEAAHKRIKLQGMEIAAATRKLRILEAEKAETGKNLEASSSSQEGL